MILLSTPHGIADLNNFLFYLNPNGFGWADTDNCGCPPGCYNVSAIIDGPQSLQIVDTLMEVSKDGSRLFPGSEGSALLAVVPYPLQFTHYRSGLEVTCLVWLHSVPRPRKTQTPFPSAGVRSSLSTSYYPTPPTQRQDTHTTHNLSTCHSFFFR